VIIFSKNH